MAGAEHQNLTELRIDGDADENFGDPIRHHLLDEQLIGQFGEALANGLPRTAGMALGFDRLVMLATGARRIEEVLWLVME